MRSSPYMVHPSSRMGDSSSTSNSCLKWTLFVSNIIMLASAVSLIIALLVSMVKWKEYIELLGDSAALAIAIVVIFIAVKMFLIAIFGCCGVTNRNTRMLTLYVVLISALIFALMIGTIVMWVRMDDTIDNVRDNMEDNMKLYSPGDATYGGVTHVWDYIQQNFECCGIDSLGDWKIHNPSYRRAKTITKYPASCLSEEIKTPYVDGCLQKIERSIEENMWTIGGIIFVIIIFLMVSSFLVCFMLMSIKRNGNQFYVEGQQQPFLDQQELRNMGKPYKATTVPIA